MKVSVVKPCITIASLDLTALIFTAFSAVQLVIMRIFLALFKIPVRLRIKGSSIWLKPGS